MWLGKFHSDIRKAIDIAYSYLLLRDFYRATFFLIDLERIYRVTESVKCWGSDGGVLGR